MNEQQILALIQDALYEVAPTRREEFATIALTTRIDDLALDSIAIMEMIGVLEDRLGTTWPEDELVKAQTLTDLAKLITQSSGVT